MKIDEFINLKQWSMSVEEYSLKFLMFCRYDPSLVSNPRDDIIRFLIGVEDLVKEEFCNAMLYDDMTLSTLMVYAQSIEESKLGEFLNN